MQKKPAQSKGPFRTKTLKRQKLNNRMDLAMDSMDSTDMQGKNPL